MSTITERFSDIAALAAVQQIVKQLDGLVKEESGKRYTRSRANRRALWEQLQDSAFEAKAALEAMAQQPKRKRTTKPTVAPPSPATTTATKGKASDSLTFEEKQRLMSAAPSAEPPSVAATN